MTETLFTVFDVACEVSYSFAFLRGIGFRLFDMGLNEYGLSLLRNRSIDNTGFREKLPILIPDLGLIQRRFLPGKTLRNVRVKFSNEKHRSTSKAHEVRASTCVRHMTLMR